MTEAKVLKMQNDEKSALKRDLQKKYGPSNYSFAEVVFENAWEKGHANGAKEVDHEYMELVRVFRDSLLSPTLPTVRPPKTDAQLAREALDLAFRMCCAEGMGFVEGYRFDLSDNPRAQKIWSHVKEAYASISATDIDAAMYAYPKHVLTVTVNYLLTDDERELVKEMLGKRDDTTFSLEMQVDGDTHLCVPSDVRVEWVE